MTGTIDYCREATYAQTRAPVSLAATLIPEAYRCPDFYRIEQEKLWAKSWVCVGYTQQLARVGDTFLARINDQSILVTRSAPDTVRAFYNVCRHRGAEILSRCGNYPFFRCPYHAWGYDLDGSLKGAPYFEAGEVTPADRALYDTSGMKAFDKAHYGLLPVRAATWGCFIFVHLDPEAPCDAPCSRDKPPWAPASAGHMAKPDRGSSPLDPSPGEPLERQLGDLPARARRYPLTDLSLTHSVDYPIEANWKLVAENYMEYYHLPWVHPTLNRVSHLHNHDWFQGDGLYYGMTTSPLEKDPEASLDGGLPPMPGLDAEEQQSARWFWLFPNVAVSLLPHHVAVMLLTPEGTCRTQERFDFFFHPYAQADKAFATVSEAVYRLWDLTNREDIAIVEAVQRGLANRAFRGGRMCFRFEQNVHRFQNHVIDKMVSGGEAANG
jgi:choline monooxygenase